MLHSLACGNSGRVFAAMDRFAPGRIRAHDSCTVCGECTAACSSGIRVHEEIGRNGMIVSNRCMRDLDCVAACPQGNLFFGDVNRAISHLSFVERHGLLEVPRLLEAQAKLQYAAGGTLFGEGRIAEAATRLREAIRLQPGNAAAQAELGALLSEQGDFMGALEHLREAIRLEPDNADPHHNLAVTLHAAGRLEEARTEIDAALRLAPQDRKSLAFRRYLIGEPFR